MIETITPAVCGSRHRYRFALAVFTVGALVAAALVGALLGLVGALVGAREAVLGVAALAALAAAREAGIVRVPLPQLRLQVPERWHFELPLPLWATGYGAGLGVGVATYQPVATFWVACAAALALAQPAAAALCFSLYGLGRALMVVLPPRPEGDVTAIVEKLAQRRPALKRANAAALVVCTVFLAAAPAAGGAVDPLPLGTGNEMDPSVSWGALAYMKRTGATNEVIVRESGVEKFRAPGRTPSIDGSRLAYTEDDGTGIRIVDWRTKTELRRISGKVSKPSLAWPRVVYKLTLADGSKRLVLRNFSNGYLGSLTTVGAGTDLGRPSLEGRRVVWHEANRYGSRVVYYNLSTNGRRYVARSAIVLVTHPSIHITSTGTVRILWITQRTNGRSYVRVRRFGSSTTYTIAQTSSRAVGYWTTALQGRTAYVTRWDVGTRAAEILKITF